MGIKFNAESADRSYLVDANKQGDTVNLIFGRRIEGQGTPLRTVTSGQMGESQIPRRWSETRGELSRSWRSAI